MIIEEFRKGRLLGELQDAIEYPLPVRIAAALWLLHKDYGPCEHDFWQMLLKDPKEFRYVPEHIRLAVLNALRDIERGIVKVNGRLQELAQEIAPTLTY
jgi:hypothetical protein